MRGLKMISTGRCLPWRSVTNKDMSELVETNDEWIFHGQASGPGDFAERRRQRTFRPVRPNRRWSGQVSVRKSWELVWYARSHRIIWPPVRPACSSGGWGSRKTSPVLT